MDRVHWLPLLLVRGTSFLRNVAPPEFSLPVVLDEAPKRRGQLLQWNAPSRHLEKLINLPLCGGISHHEKASRRKHRT